MRTNIIIDDQLMDAAIKSGNYHSKREVVEEGLKLLVQQNSQKKILLFEGKIEWDGDLEKMRLD